MKIWELHSLFNVELKYMLVCCKRSSFEKVECTEIVPKIQTVKRNGNNTIVLRQEKK